MAKDKEIRVTIPGEFNKELIVYLEEVNGVLTNKITKAELIIRLAKLGLQIEKEEIAINKE